MSWRDNFLQASFRGVPFHTERHDMEGGRRQIAHKVPGRDGATYEDQGRKPRVHNLQCFLLGDDYAQQRNNLLRALERRGSGLLVHPTLGARIVVVGNINYSERNRHGRTATIEVAFHEAATPSLPIILIAAAASAEVAGDKVVAKAATVLQQKLVYKAVPQQVRAAASTAVEDFGKQAQAQDVFGGDSNPLSTISQKAAELAHMLKAQISAATELIQQPTLLSISLQQSIDLVAQAAQTQASALAAYKNLAAFVPQLPLGTSGTVKLAAANASTIASYLKHACLARAVAAAANVPWTTYEDAVAARDELAGLIEAELGAADDTIFGDLQSLAAALAGAVPPPDKNLPHISTLTLPGTLDAGVLAYRLYDDVAREAEIVSRNKVKHPGFVPGGVPIQVLVDA